MREICYAKRGCARPWCVFIGDIEGHGLAAAMVMAIVQAVLHVHPAGIATAAGLLRYGNQQLCSSRVSGLVSAFLGIYEPASRRLTYSCAGPSASVAEACGGRGGRALDGVGSYPLGIDESETFREAPCNLNETTPFCFTPMGSPRREAWRKHHSALIGSRACFATEATGLRKSSTGCARPCGRTCIAKPPKTTRPLSRQESFRGMFDGQRWLADLGRATGIADISHESRRITTCPHLARLRRAGHRLPTARRSLSAASAAW